MQREADEAKTTAERFEEHLDELKDMNPGSPIMLTVAEAMELYDYARRYEINIWEALTGQEWRHPTE